MTERVPVPGVPGGARHRAAKLDFPGRRLARSALRLDADTSRTPLPRPSSWARRSLTLVSEWRRDRICAPNAPSEPNENRSHAWACIARGHEHRPADPRRSRCVPAQLRAHRPRDVGARCARDSARCQRTANAYRGTRRPSRAEVAARPVRHCGAYLHSPRRATDPLGQPRGRRQSSNRVGRKSAVRMHQLPSQI